MLCLWLVSLVFSVTLFSFECFWAMWKTIKLKENSHKRKFSWFFCNEFMFPYIYHVSLPLQHINHSNYCRFIYFLSIFFDTNHQLLFRSIIKSIEFSSICLIICYWAPWSNSIFFFSNQNWWIWWFAKCNISHLKKNSCVHVPWIWLSSWIIVLLNVYILGDR